MTQMVRFIKLFVLRIIFVISPIFLFVFFSIWGRLVGTELLKVVTFGRNASTV